MTVTPAISSPVPDQCHSLHSVSPSVVARISSARKSGTPANTSVQFVRTCSAPTKARSGCAGWTLS